MINMLNTMLFKAFQTISDYNTTKGPHVTLLQMPNDVSGGWFVPLLLFVLFTIVNMGTYFSQKRLFGKGDFVASFCVAGFFTAIIAIIMTAMPNVINTFTVVIAIVVAIIGFVWLIISRNE